MKRGWIMALAVALSACGEQKAETSIFDDAVIVKICADGSRIFRLNDGRFIAGGWGQRLVEDPQTVCAPK